MKWIAVYVKFVSEDYPLDQELHGWECEGENPLVAVEELEKSPIVPYRIFLVDVIPEEKADIWLEEAKAEAQSLGCEFSYTLHRRLPL